MSNSERPWQFAAVHEKNSWRKATHTSRETAISGRDGAENLLRNRKRVGEKASDKENGPASAVFVWDTRTTDDTNANATGMRLVPGSAHDIEQVSVPVSQLLGFSASDGPSLAQIKAWFEKSTSAMETYQSIRPKQLNTIYQVALQAGLSGKPWEFSRHTGEPLLPSNNSYQNALWSFGGGKEPHLAAIWWSDMVPEGERIVHRGDFQAEIQKMANKKTAMKISGERDTRLGMKIKKAKAFDSLIKDAHWNHRPIRIAIVDGHTPKTDDEAYDSSKAKARELDPEPWWVHSLSPYGEYVLVRGIESPPRVTIDPFDDAPELGTEDDFIEWLEDAPLSDTEKDALVKVRVGQGYFRNALKTRWKGCAVNLCRNDTLLIASHIKPWSKCETRAERLSPDNGILLSPTLDKAFDRGFISFSDKFKILLHPKLDLQARNTLRIDEGMRLSQSHEGMKPFLKWHRQFHGFEPSEQ